MRRLKQALEILLHVHDTPHRVGLSFGIGVWIAFFPIWGIHTLMALGIAFALRMSRAAMVIGAYVNNPWTMGPFYLGGTIVGCWLLGVPASELAAIDFSFSGPDGWRGALAQLEPFLWPFVVGNTVVGVAGGALGYAAVRWALERRARTTDGVAPAPV